MALEEPSGQVTAEFTDTFFAPVEGDELVLILGVEQQVESGGGVGEKALAEFLAALSEAACVSFMTATPGGWVNGLQRLGYLIPITRAQERDCTPPQRRAQGQSMFQAG